MAEIRDFNRNQYLLKDKNKKSNVVTTDDPNDKRSAENMLARHRQIKRNTVIFLVIIIGIIFACSYFQWKNTVYTYYEVIQQSDWERSQEAKCMRLGNMLFAYSKDGMSCTDIKGNMVWNQTYEMQNPIVRICDNTVAVGDYNGRNIYISNAQSGNLGKIETTLPIRDFCVSANGIVAVVLDDSVVTAIYMYDSSGKRFADFKTTMSKSGYPVAVDISDDGSLVGISYIKAEKGKVSSHIAFYNFSAVGQNYTDNLVSGYGYSEAIVPIINFMNNDTVFAVADNRLMFYKGRQKPENLTDIVLSEEIQSVYYSDDYIGLVYYNVSGDTTYKMEVYDTSATKVYQIDFDTEYTDIMFSEYGIVIRSDNECLIYDWEKRLKYEGDFLEKIECMLPNGSVSKYTLVTDDTIQQIELR